MKNEEIRISCGHQIYVSVQYRSDLPWQSYQGNRVKSFLDSTNLELNVGPRIGLANPLCIWYCLQGEIILNQMEN